MREKPGGRGGEGVEGKFAVDNSSVYPSRPLTSGLTLKVMLWQTVDGPPLPSLSAVTVFPTLAARSCLPTLPKPIPLPLVQSAYSKLC